MEDNQAKHKRKRINKKSLEKEFCRLVINKREKKRRKNKEVIERENTRKLINTLDLSLNKPYHKIHKRLNKKLAIHRRKSSIDHNEFQLSESYSYSDESDSNEFNTNNDKTFGKNLIIGQFIDQQQTANNSDDSASEGNSVIMDYIPKNNLSSNNINITNLNLNNTNALNNNNNNNSPNNENNNISPNFNRYDNIQFYPTNQESNFNLSMIKKDMIPMLNFISFTKIKENILSNWKDNNNIHSFFDNLLSDGKTFITIYHKGPSYLREHVFSNLSISFEKKEFFFMQMCKMFSSYAFDFDLSLPLPDGVVQFHLMYPDLVFSVDKFVKIDQSNQFFFYNFIGKNLLHFLVKVKLNLLPQNKKMSLWNEF